MKYIDAEKLKEEIKRFSAIEYNDNTFGDDVANGALDYVLEEIIPSLQQEPIPDTDVLHTKLANLLKTYRIGEETAITLADRIADTYGAQRYMDGLCNEMDKKDTKQEQIIGKNTLTWRDINDLERIINNVHYEFRNGIGEKSFGEEVLERFREERDEQEQPEVDLDEETLREEFRTVDRKCFDEGIEGWQREKLIARRFYELGLNARKK